VKKTTRLALLAVLISLTAVSGFAEKNASGLDIVSFGAVGGVPSPQLVMVLISLFSSVAMP